MAECHTSDKEEAQDVLPSPREIWASGSTQPAPKTHRREWPDQPYCPQSHAVSVDLSLKGPFRQLEKGSIDIPANYFLLQRRIYPAPLNASPNCVRAGRF